MVWIDPCDIADSAKIQKNHRRLHTNPFCTGKMEKRSKRRTLTAQFDISRSEIPNHGNTKEIGQCRAITQLQRALITRSVGDCLAMKSDQIDLRKTPQQRTMRFHNHVCCARQAVAIPMTQSSMQNLTLLNCVRQVFDRPKPLDGDAVGLKHCCIDTI